MTQKEKITIVPQEVFSECLIVNKSRFIAYVKHIDTVSEGIQFVAEIKKKHYDATHNCYAYVCDGSTKFSDDGEPSGTAGKPILNVLISKGLFDCVVVVTRYFGGIKLGAGGLVRAYSGAAAQVLEKAQFCNITICVDAIVEGAYNLQNAIVSAVNTYAHKIQTQYGEGIKIIVSLQNKDLEKLKEEVIDATNGRATISFSTPYQWLLPIKL